MQLSNSYLLMKPGFLVLLPYPLSLRELQVGTKVLFGWEHHLKKKKKKKKKKKNSKPELKAPSLPFIGGSSVPHIPLTASSISPTQKMLKIPIKH